MKHLMRVIQEMNISLNARMDSMQNSLLNLKIEITAMQTDMATKEVFQRRENRVAVLDKKVVAEGTVSRASGCSSRWVD